MSKLLFLDLCGTLVEENTTFDFFQKVILPRKSLLIRGLWKSRIIQLITKLLLLFNIRFDLTKRICLHLMKGYSLIELQTLSKCYVDGLQWRIGVLNQVNKLIQSGYKPVIVSASLSFLVERVCEFLSIDDFISSELEFNHKGFTGHLITDLQGNKLEFLLHDNNIKSIFYTDNLDDVNCKHVVDYFIAVTTAKNYSYWKKNKALIYVV